jgi:hypothetical protein
VDAGFFFVHTMKWTLLHQSYGKLTTRQKCLAVDHAVQAHLIPEIELIQPNAIIAFGAGAWDACLLLADRYGQPPFIESRVNAARLRHYNLQPPKQDGIPLHATFLPGTINENLAKRVPAITDDLGVFLRCIAGRIGCEAVEQRVRVVASRPSKRGFSKAELRDFKGRLKALGLWPLPPHLTNEQFAQEVARRLAAQ